MPRINEDQLKMLAEAYGNNAPVADLRNVSGLGSASLLRKLFQAVEHNYLSHDSLDRFLKDETLRDFPDNLDARIEAVGSAVNFELKQAAILTLQTHTIPTAVLYRRVKTLVGPDADIGSPVTFQIYYERTFGDIGFLTTHTYELEEDPEIKAFAISDAGERYGVPIAAFSLMHGVKHNISMYQLLGKTATGGESRAPFNRIRIFELIDETKDPKNDNLGSIEMSELERRLGIDQGNVLRHLVNLKKLGIVDYEALFEKPYSLAERVSPDDVLPFEAYPILTARVAECLSEHGSLTPTGIAIRLGLSSISNTSEVLTYMAEEGYATTQFSGHQRSSVYLGPNAKLMREWIQKVRGALSDGPELEEMEKMAANLMSDPDLARSYLEPGIVRYNRISPYRGKKSTEERNKELVAAVEGLQGMLGRPPINDEIASMMDISRAYVSEILVRVIKKGDIMAITEGTPKPMYGTPTYLNS